MIAVAPKPEVQYLPAVLRRVSSGEICIPAFQREFVWKSAQILSLLDSVYRGFPISSLLFWKAPADQLKIQEKRNFPPIPEDAPRIRSFILDGQQRLTTLYGVFNYDEALFDSNFRVVFDLISEQFKPADDSALSSFTIPLSNVFQPRLFLERQRSLLDGPGGNVLVEKAINLHTTFQEYLIPLVTIESENIDDVVKIFERINSTGTHLSSVDFMRAVTWSPEFDLSAQIDRLQERFQDNGFSFDDETFVKCIAVTLGRDPTAVSMLTLRNCPTETLELAIDRVEESLGRVIAFLKDNFAIMSADFVAYEAQLVVLSHFLMQRNDDLAIDLARRWFLGTGIGEGLRGRSDFFVSGLIHDIDRSITDGEGLSSVLKATSYNPTSSFIERRFIKGRALSTSTVLLYALNQARDLITGEIIAPDGFLKSFTPDSFQPILPSMPFGASGSYGAHRRIANLFLAGNSKFNNVDVINLILSGTIDSKVLSSQFIGDDAVDALERDDAIDFAFKRAHAIAGFADALIDESMPWPKIG